MAQNISLLGAVYSAVPAVLLPKQGGGTAQFTDVTPTTAAKADVASGKIFFDSSGNQQTGTASGGSGLVYESGTYTPTADTARPTISFTGSHTDPPMLVLMCDTSGSSGISSNSNTVFCYENVYRAFNSGYPYSTSAQRYGIASYTYRGSNNSTSGTVQVQYSGSGSSTSYEEYWVTKSAFYPYSNSSSRYWRKNRTYEWIAVWKP